MFGRLTARKPVSRSAAVGLAVLLLGGVAGCGDGNVWVYVDNTGTAPLVVSVDGKPEATVAPGTFDVIKTPPGKKRIQAERNGSVVYSGTRELKEAEKWGTTRKYLFDPDGRSRYVTYTVKYGSSRFEGMIEAALASQGNEAGMIRVAYKKLSDQVTLHPPDSWIDISRAQYVLTAPPQSVSSRSSTETRTGLTRVPRETYAKLESALGRRDPNERDLAALADAIEDVWDAAP